MEGGVTPMGKCIRSEKGLSTNPRSMENLHHEEHIAGGDGCQLGSIDRPFRKSMEDHILNSNGYPMGSFISLAYDEHDRREVSLYIQSMYFYTSMGIW